MNNKKAAKSKTTKSKTTNGRDITAEVAKKRGKKVSTELPNSYKNGTGKTDKSGRSIPE